MTPLHFSNLFQTYLQENSISGTPENLYSPIQYIMSLGGKRVRPLLSLLAYAMFDKHVEKALPVAYAVELFHNFSLVHDDIMDAAPLRRGKPTVHTLYGVNTGILSGDVMLVYAYEQLCKVGDATTTAALLRVFNEVAIGVCEGQQLDMNFEQQSSVALEAYVHMITLKTAVLLAGALRMGAIAAGASLEEQARLTEFGIHIGVAFQLQDDLLDTFGNPATFGKKVGGDIVQNKKTYLYLLALQQANAADRAALLSLYDPTATELAEAEKISRVTALFNAYHIAQQTEQLVDEYTRQAFVQLEQITADHTAKTLLATLATDLMQRVQ